jgi:PAS domain S-box-containing protein
MKVTPFDDNSVTLKELRAISPGTLYIFDLQKKSLTWINGNIQAIYGLESQDLLNHGAEIISKLIHPDDHAHVENVLRRVHNSKPGEIFNVEFRVEDKSKNYHWIANRVVVHSHDDQQKPTSILCYASDIDEQKAYELNLRNTIEKLNLSLSAAKMGTWEWDVENRRSYWDTYMQAIHGIHTEPGESTYEGFMNSVLQEDLPAVREMARTSAADKKDFYVTYRVRHPDQTIHHIRCYGKVLQNPNKGLRMYGVAWDASEEHLTEQQIEDARAKMIASTKMAALGEMSGGIAHEINNPLTVIQARAFQLTQMVEHKKLDESKILQAAESISRTAEKIARIIRSLRSFAREGSMDPYDLISVKQIIEETLDLCRIRFYNHGIDIQVVDVPEDVELECRLIQIEQVLLNLLNNSFDAVQKLDNKWIRISAQETDKHIEIRVTDSGPGIPAELRDKIMLPFFTTKEVGKGTGLGLSISMGIIKSHNGELFLDTNSPQTSFVIRMPKLQH